MIFAWLPEKRLDLHMTLIVALRLEDGYLVVSDGNSHRYIDDKGNTEFETAHQQKIFKVAKNVVFGIAGDVEKGLLGVFTEEVEEYFQGDVIDDLETHKDALEKFVKRFFKIHATVLFINHKSLLWIPGSPDLPATTTMGIATSSVLQFREDFKDKIVGQQEAVKLAKKLFEDVHADNQRVGGLITSWLVKRDSTMFEGELALIDSGV